MILYGNALKHIVFHIANTILSFALSWVVWSGHIMLFNKKMHIAGFKYFYVHKLF